MPSKVLTGSRAIIRIDGAIVGIFETCTYNMNIGTEPIHILGAYASQEITPTSYEAVTLSCSGFRVVGAGPYMGSPSAQKASGVTTDQAGYSDGSTLSSNTGPSVPMLQDLMSADAITITVTDRQTGAVILTAQNCIGNSYNGNHNARATSRVTINYTGTVMFDESGSQTEAQGASSLP
jgi:hypothetical protein